MKAGDLVKIIGSHSSTADAFGFFGTIVEPWAADGWWTVLTQRGQIINWPESQMELINESR